MARLYKYIKLYLFTCRVTNKNKVTIDLLFQTEHLRDNQNYTVWKAKFIYCLFLFKYFYIWKYQI